MRERSSKKVNAFLRVENKNLNIIIAKVKEINELNQKFSAYVDPHMRDYCQVANRIGSRLIILTANGSVATQLRFQGVDLIRKFKQDPMLKKIQEIHCIVRPIDTKRFLVPATKKVALLSEETAETIKAISDSLEDPKLKEVMQKIASHTNKKR